MAKTLGERVLRKGTKGSLREKKNNDGSITVRYELPVTMGGKRNTSLLARTFRGKSVTALIHEIREHAEWATEEKKALKKNNSAKNLDRVSSVLDRTFNDVYHEFIEGNEHFKPKGEQTVLGYGLSIKKYYQKILDVKIKDISEDHAEIILNEVILAGNLRGQPYAFQTIRDQFKPLFSVMWFVAVTYKFGSDNGGKMPRINKDTFLRLRGFVPTGSVVDNKGRVFNKSAEDILGDMLPLRVHFELLDSYNWRTDEGLREACKDDGWLIHTLGIGLGLRISEVAALRPEMRTEGELTIAESMSVSLIRRLSSGEFENIKIVRGQKVLPKGSCRTFETVFVKNRVTSHVRILPELIIRIFNILDETTKPGDFYFQGPRRRWIKKLRGEEFEYLRFGDRGSLLVELNKTMNKVTGHSAGTHENRHFFAGAYRLLGGSTIGLQSLMNHKKIENTLRYDKLFQLAYKKEDLSYLRTRIKLSPCFQTIEFI